MEDVKVKVIPAKPKLKVVGNTPIKRRVCGYARVSTDNEEQESSFDSQVKYYTNYIKRNDLWQFVGLYSDLGISGTSTKHREGFKKMVSDAIDGKIDLILTKSISRFARNTVDTLQTVRLLKEHNVEVYFEKENIYTFDSKGELILSLMSSISQEESRSISSNTTWGIRKRFEEGHVRMNRPNFLGYRVDREGNVIVMKDEAKTIKLIYKLFMEGYGYKGIARELNLRHLKTPADCGIWRDNTVKSILTNCKYMGDVESQKYVTVDYLTKKQKKNDGDVPKYYVENNHEPIVKKVLFLAVQEEIKKRKSIKISKDIIANKVICGLCNGHFGKRVWHSNDKYRTVVYRCIDKYKGDTCKNTYIKEDEIKDMFVKALNKTIENKDEIIENIKNIKSIIPDENTYILERDKLDRDLTELADRINAIVRDSARGIDSGDYDKKVLEYETMKEKCNNLSKKIDNIIERKSKLDLFIKNIEEVGIVTEWTSDLWGIFLDKMLIYKDKVEVIFNYGETVTINR